ncbi:MAG: 3-hydroxyacyl-ACP dehydratase FabZ [Deltaproteobacteria bacterium]|nr:3-hydroxyacyl-ACP dehydratase FabZ [Deltaproteobacteria bacterium]
MANFQPDTLDSVEIQKILPHRYPFLLVDRVTERHQSKSSPVGDRVVAYKGVTYNEPFFKGHFPEAPMMPGVLILEALAQASALIIFPMLSGGKNDYEIYLTSVNEARFRYPVFPGNLLRLESEVKKVRMRKVWVFYGQAFIEEEGEKILVAEAEISTLLKLKSERGPA